MITLFITIIIFLLINFSINKIQGENQIENPEQNINLDIISKNEEQKENPEEEKNQEEENWYVEIKSISLKAPIEETTEMEVLEKSVGHFEDTQLTLGNIGLAAHNNGYKNNYFKDLKNVKKGDEILYKYKDFTKRYIVNTIKIIKNTNWSYLENTTDNRITLITCVEGKPDYRICVQAVEKL